MPLLNGIISQVKRVRLRRVSLHAGALLFAMSLLVQKVTAQQALTWQEVEAHFRANNPTLLAGQVTIDESRADEITAYLRPNPNLNLGLDQIAPFYGNPYRPLSQAYPSGSIDYLHEREHKRELRLDSAKKTTLIAISTQKDLERNLMYNLRDAFVRVLLAKSVRRIAAENIEYYDKEIAVNRERFKAGAMARVDFQRVELQRVQFESDLQNAEVNLQTAKIDLLAFLRDPAPLNQFDVIESFEFKDELPNLDSVRQIAVETRPDLKEAQESVEFAKINHRLSIANGSADPTFSIDLAHQPSPLNTYIGFGVSIPLRIFDRNQGDKLHTQLDIGRTEKVRQGTEIAALHDVDSAFATLNSTLVLLKPYKQKYLKEASDIRETVSFAYEHGAASLLDFLDAQNEYRTTQLNYVNLVGSYLSAANQLNFSVGREVIQ